MSTLVASVLALVAIGYIASTLLADKTIGAVETFKKFGRGSKITLVLMFTIGLILLAFFWTTDIGIDVTFGPWNIKRPNWLKSYDQDWMNSHAYAPNILAGLTGFLIGAPVAAVILASFTTEREEKVALDRVNRLSALAWDSFRDLVKAFASHERWELVAEQGRDIEKYYHKASVAIDESIWYAAETFAGAESRESIDATSLTNQIEVLKIIEKNFRTAINALRQNINFFETENEWAQIVGSWRVLDQFVRLQRLEQGLEWFDKTPDAGLRKWTSREGNPLQELLDAIEIRRYTQDPIPSVTTMANALDTLASYTRMDDPIDLGEYLLYERNIFTLDRSSAYHIKRDAAHTFILDLQRCIGLVEATYWPRLQTVPKREGDKREPTIHEQLAFFASREGQKQMEKLAKRIRRVQRWRTRIERILWGVPSEQRISSTETKDDSAAD